MCMIEAIENHLISGKAIELKLIDETSITIWNNHLLFIDEIGITIDNSGPARTLFGFPGKKQSIPWSAITGVGYKSYY